MIVSSHSCSVSFIATLIYGAVLHHRHRRSRYSYCAQHIPSRIVAESSTLAHGHGDTCSSAGYGCKEGPFTEDGLIIPHYDDSIQPKAPMEELSAAGALYELQSSNERYDRDEREERVYQ